MKSLPILVGVCLLATASHAQERTAAGTLETQMSWSALSNIVKDANAKTMAAHSRIDVLSKDLDALKKCGTNGKLWTGVGCKEISMPDPAALDIQTHTKTLCKQGGNHTLMSSCPAGERLLGCGGGPGDQKEYGEYWVLMPDFKKNRCIGYAGMPWCNPNTYYGQTIVTAICYKP